MPFLYYANYLFSLTYGKDVPKQERRFVIQHFTKSYKQSTNLEHIENAGKGLYVGLCWGEVGVLWGDLGLCWGDVGMLWGCNMYTLALTRILRC